MKYKVVSSTLFIAGQKYRRGDIVELADATEYGVRVEPHVEPEPPKPVRRTRAKKVEVSDEDR